MKPNDRVHRIQDQQPTEATVLQVQHDSALIAYDEGGEGWWPVTALTIIDDTNWPAFKRAMLTDPDINAAIATALPTAPLAVLALPTALNNATDGDYADFRSCWTVIRRVASLPPAVIAAVHAEAQAANLPPSFLELLIP